MSNIDALKQAVAKLENDLVGLRNAEQDLANWESHDLTREDGSGAQDARHEEIGRSSREDVSEARREVASQKAVVATLLAGM